MTSFLKVFYVFLALNVISYVAAFSEEDDIEVTLLFWNGVNVYGMVQFNFTIDECIKQGCCSDNTTTKDEILNQVSSLGPSFLTEKFSTFYNPFEIGSWKLYQETVDGGIRVYKVFVRRNKYIAMIIIYSIVSIGLYLVHHFKKRLSLEYQFKPSKVSKLMLNYLAFKTVFKFIYLALMFSYIPGDTTKFSLGLVYLTCEDYIQGPVTFALAVLFAMGYGTRRFKIDASMAWKTTLLTACNVLLTLPGLFQLQKDWKVLKSVCFELPLTILYYGLISICIYIGYNTYKLNRDQRYLDSAGAIIIGVLLNPIFAVPGMFRKIFREIRNFLVESVVRSNYQLAYGGMAKTDLIELVVIIYLIYVWRDIREEDLEYVELEKMRT